MVYDGIIHSKLQYGIACYGCAHDNACLNLEVNQKGAVRRIAAAWSIVHFYRIFVKLNILPLRQLFILRVLKMFFISGGFYQTGILPNYNVRSNFYNMVTLKRSKTSRHFLFYDSLCKRLQFSTYLNKNITISQYIWLRFKKRFFYFIKG